jgi:hypothetical protein
MVLEEAIVQNPELSATIERHLREQAELHVSVRVQHDQVILEGWVSSPEARQAAEDLAAHVALGYRIENHLEIEDLRPEEVRHIRTATADDLRAVEPDIHRFAPTPPEPEHASADDADLDPELARVRAVHPATSSRSMPNSASWSRSLRAPYTYSCRLGRTRP